VIEPATLQMAVGVLIGRLQLRNPADHERRFRPIVNTDSDRC
jgi:hypothetical protein